MDAVATQEKTTNGNRLLVKSFLHDESGQDLIEYALIAALLALAAITAMSNLATSVENVFSSVGSSL